MEQYIDDNFLVQYPSELSDFIRETIKIAHDKKKFFCLLFDCEMTDVKPIKTSFFTQRDAFVNYIKSVSNNQTPPTWATGCFYNGEIQILVDEKNKNAKLFTLSHETLHLFFNQLVYNRYSLARLRWLDEAYATFFDGHITALSQTEIENKLQKLMPLKERGFDVNLLNEMRFMETFEYNSYDIFMFVGKYIYEKNLQKEFINLLRNDRLKLMIIGKTILADALNYFSQTHFLNN